MDTAQLSLIAGTTAQVSCQIAFDFIVGWFWIFPEKGNGIHNHTRIAETTLLGTLIGNKAAKLLGFFLQTLQRLYFMSVGSCGQYGTGSTGVPSRNTVQRPQFVVSQPHFTL